MLPLKKIILLNLSLFVLSTALSQQKDSIRSNGFVNFNLGTSTISSTGNQPITMFGCNTVLQADSTHWHGPTKGFVWGASNQILSDVPYGWKYDSLMKDHYFVSKYYIASPPVFHLNKNDTIDNNTVYDIGIVTPDEFVFKGDKPVQRVFLDYNILDTTQITYFPVVFDGSFQKIADSLGNKINVDYVPFKVECADFGWLDIPGMSGGAGASGIGSFYRKSPKLNRLFLPYPALTKDQPNVEYLDCNVTILNDILYHYEVFFVIGGVTSETLDLKDYQKNHANEPISFHCKYREDLPCGCKPIEGVSPYGEE